MHAEERDDPDVDALHVIGRTYATPHTYFYRRHAHGQWTPWEPIAAEIEGDHVAAVMWRDRLHLFWVTFLDTAEPDWTASPATSSAKTADEAIKPKVEVGLNWTEYVRGQWAPRSATKTTTLLEREVGPTFDSSHLLVYIASEPTDGADDALLICLFGDAKAEASFQTPAAFRLATKNSPPAVVPADSPVPAAPASPYHGPWDFDATRRAARRDPRLTRPDPDAPGHGKAHDSGQKLATILDAAPFGDYELLLANHELTQPPPDPALAAPFFYEDAQHTFFVEPRLSERTVAEWVDWTLDPSRRYSVDGSDGPPGPPVEAAVPDLHVEVASISPLARFAVAARTDWVTAPESAITFDGAVITRYGGEERARALAADVVSGNGHLPILTNVG